MVNVVPFKGVRPKADLVAKVSSVPYDVISSEEARDIVAQNPHSFLKVIKPEVDLDPQVDIYDDSVYETGKKNLRNLVSEGNMIKDDSACFYVYRQQMGEHIQTGLVAGASVQDYVDDKIKKHEFTREEKEIDRTRHIDSLNCNTGPVFLTYHHNEAIDTLIGEVCKESPVYDFTADDGIKHTFWIVDDAAKINKLTTLFSQIDKLYVADGHHRSAAATRVREKRQQANPLHFGGEPYNFFLTVIFPDNQMQILSYNRVVKDLNGLSGEELLEKLGEIFTISPTDNPVPQQKHQFCMYVQQKWYLLECKDSIVEENDPVKSLDVYILQEYVLSPMLGIGNPRKDKRIDFVGGIRGAKALEERVSKNNDGVAFTLYPVDILSLINIADAGEVMPPKSTWFEPKLRSGIILHPLS
ncbi:DUF1015 domain-containing protein [Candidatus Uabimicrobium amorphum]|uniref:DUF1015 domain-containing protein n=1 Tax=Uabimicrobium amorphum TaxID=2596890 RepID=A0A5S9ITN0_UABAM|nr:DUF1015 domain-containing protein [Candidatus Uabimicrobium amorphum]BBM87889.1 hypothetical protein UABAM_06304 [Candidatus Uabimicrobium amorphum]